MHVADYTDTYTKCSQIAAVPCLREILDSGNGSRSAALAHDTFWNANKEMGTQLDRQTDRHFSANQFTVYTKHRGRDL